MHATEQHKAPAATTWCQCCLDAGCPKHMEHTDTTVPCVVCGQPCQCAGCAANSEPAGSAA